MEYNKNVSNESIIKFIFLVLGVLYVLTFLTYVIDVDSAQYAAISMEMHQSNQFIYIYDRGVDYLDKPPLLFWFVNVFYSIFGISSWSYKIPSFLAFIGILFYTFKFGELLYSDKVGQLATLILGTSLGYYYFMLDVKTDVLMTFFMVGSTYYMYTFLKHPTNIRAVMIALFISGSLQSKGMQGLVFPLLGFFPYVLVNKKIPLFISKKGMLIFIVLFVSLIPMLVGLHLQFDLHPEKIVNSKYNVSGLRFFFWEQSFGRITGENYYKNEAGYFYFLHTFLLFTFPWSILVFHKIILTFRNFRSTLKSSDLLMLSLLILPMVALSFSHYKLPHYVFCLLPFAAILISEFIISQNLNSKSYRFHYVFILIASIILVLLGLFSIYSFYNPYYLAIAILWLIVIYLLTRNRFFENDLPLVKYAVLSSMFFGIVFYSMVGPYISSLQFGPKLANKIIEHKIPKEKIAFLNRTSHALELRLGKRIPVVTVQELKIKLATNKYLWLVMNKEARYATWWENIKFTEEITVEYYDLNRIKLGLVFPSLRSGFMDKIYLVKVEPTIFQ